MFMIHISNIFRSDRGSIGGFGVLFDSGNIMDWLLQNWVWIPFGIVLVVMMRRGGCCGMRRAAHDKSAASDGPQIDKSATGSAGPQQ